MRRAALAIGWLFVATLTAGCGAEVAEPEVGSSPTPTVSTPGTPPALPTGRASEREFCAEYLRGRETVQIGATDEPQSLAALKSWVADMRTLGTPPGMPEQARGGFDVVLATLDSLPDVATLVDLDRVLEELDRDQREAMEAVGEYTEKVCVDELDELMFPSDRPTQ